jgi:hypothetical protein
MLREKDSKPMESGLTPDNAGVNQSDAGAYFERRQASDLQRTVQVH